MKFQKNGQTIFLENGEEGLLSQSVMSYAWQSVTIKVIWVKHDYESKEVDERMFVAESAELMKEWNTMRNSALGLDPARLKIRSNKKVWWICSNGHEWEAKICNRSNGRGCPCCANRVVVKGKNDLATLFPRLAEEWDKDKNGALKPDGIVPGHNGKVWWRCSKCGYVYQAPPSRRSQGSGCRKCADKAIWSIRRANKERANAKNGYIQMELFDETKKATQSRCCDVVEGACCRDYI